MRLQTVVSINISFNETIIDLGNYIQWKYNPKTAQAAEGSSVSYFAIPFVELDFGPYSAKLIYFEALWCLQQSSIDVGNNHIEGRLNFSKVKFVSQKQGLEYGCILGLPLLFDSFI